MFGYYYMLFDAEIDASFVGASCKCSNGERIGSMRTYAFIPRDQEFSFANWIEAVRAGRTFISNGALIHFTVGGEVPGRNYHTWKKGETLQIRAESMSGPQYHRLELIWNGNVIQSVACASTFPFRAQLVHELHPQKSGWLAVRCVSKSLTLGTMAHTSPIAIRLEQDVHWAQPDKVRVMLDVFDKTIEWTKTRTHPPRPRLVHLYEEARTALAKKLSP